MTNISYALSNRCKQDSYLQFQKMLAEFQMITEAKTGADCKLLVKLHNTHDAFMHPPELIGPQVWASAKDISVYSYAIDPGNSTLRLCAEADFGPPGSNNITYRLYGDNKYKVCDDAEQPAVRRSAKGKILPFPRDPSLTTKS